MKTFLAALAALSALALGPAHAYDQFNAWGTTPSKSNSVTHYNYGQIAGQVNDGAALSGRVSNVTNYACGTCITVNGSENVNIDSNHNGNTTAEQNYHHNK